MNYNSPTNLKVEKELEKNNNNNINKNIKELQIKNLRKTNKYNHRLMMDIIPSQLLIELLKFINNSG